MTPRRDPAQKADALAVYVMAGAEVAAAQTGVPASTIRAWASKEGIVPRPGAVPVQAEVVRRKWAERRAGEADEAGEAAIAARRQVIELLEAGKILDAQRAALTFAILVDKSDKLAGTGTAPGRSFDSAGPSIGEATLDQEIEELLGLAVAARQHGLAPLARAQPESHNPAVVVAPPLPPPTRTDAPQCHNRRKVVAAADHESTDPEPPGRHHGSGPILFEKPGRDGVPGIVIRRAPK